MKAGNNQSEIAKVLERNKYNITFVLASYRAIRCYRYNQTCELSGEPAKNSRRASSVGQSVRKEAGSFLQLQVSPQQIAARLAISFETLHQLFYAEKA